jgi:hypothetical protein
MRAWLRLGGVSSTEPLMRRVLHLSTRLGKVRLIAPLELRCTLGTGPSASDADRCGVGCAVVARAFAPSVLGRAGAHFSRLHVAGCVGSMPRRCWCYVRLAAMLWPDGCERCCGACLGTRAAAPSVRLTPGCIGLALLLGAISSAGCECQPSCGVFGRRRTVQLCSFCRSACRNAVAVHTWASRAAVLSCAFAVMQGWDSVCCVACGFARRCSARHRPSTRTSQRGMCCALATWHRPSSRRPRLRTATGRACTPHGGRRCKRPTPRGAHCALRGAYEGAYTRMDMHGSAHGNGFPRVRATTRACTLVPAIGRPTPSATLSPTQVVGENGTRMLRRARTLPQSVRAQPDTISDSYSYAVSDSCPYVIAHCTANAEVRWSIRCHAGSACSL